MCENSLLGKREPRGTKSHCSGFSHPYPADKVNPERKQGERARSASHTITSWGLKLPFPQWNPEANTPAVKTDSVLAPGSPRMLLCVSAMSSIRQVSGRVDTAKWTEINKIHDACEELYGSHGIEQVVK